MLLQELINSKYFNIIEIENLLVILNFLYFKHCQSFLFLQIRDKKNKDKKQR